MLHDLFAAYDLPRLRPLLTFNLPFVGAYLSILPMNRLGCRPAERNVGIFAAMIQLAVMTYFISNGVGFQLFYFSVGGVLSLAYARPRKGLTLTLMGVAAVLYLLCHFLYPPGQT